MNKQELSAMVAQILASMQAEPAVKASDYKPADPGPQPRDTHYGDGDFVEDVSRLDGKVDALEMKPGKRWEGLTDKLLWGVAGAVLTWLLARAGL